MKPRCGGDTSAAREALDAHVRETILWHFSPETGTPHWLEWADGQDWDPLTTIETIDDLQRFPNFDGDLLRTEPHERFIPKAFEGRPFTIFETGGTTGLPKQRIGWEDYRHDYEEFSETLDDEAFPPGCYWLMVGPTGPRRLRLAIEHLAHVRGSSCYFVDLDPRWVKKLIKSGQTAQATEYMTHVVDQAVAILEARDVSVLFTTPRLLEALALRCSIPDSGIKGVFCGGTTMDPEYTRFLVEEVLEGKVGFVPTYGNTLMGLAAHKPGLAEDGYSITYHAPQPRAVLRVVNPDEPLQTVAYGDVGRVELTTLTQELFMPRFLERDEGIRREPCREFPWDGVGEVRPFGAQAGNIVEGVY